MEGPRMNPQDSISAEQTPAGRAAPATDDGSADTGKGEDKPRSIQEVGADGKKRAWKGRKAGNEMAN